MASDTEIEQEHIERNTRTRDRLARLGKTFTPTRPVQTREIFAGRTEQLIECLGIPATIGLHGILFGDRGVGKTSIANMVRLLSGGREPADNCNVIKIECTSSDSFSGIVKQIYKNVMVDVPNDNMGFCVGPAEDKSITLLSLMTENSSYNPKDVASVLHQASGRILVILDEFDRLSSECFDLSSFTELLKIISDLAVDAHFLIVGVGDSVDEIIGNHASVVRNLTQIKLGTMTAEEIREIVVTGAKKLDMEIPREVEDKIVDFSCGYPHYTHLLSFNAFGNAIHGDRIIVESADLDFAVGRALNKAQESVKSSYHAATMANRTNIYKEVLQACGEVMLDSYNTFVPKDVEKPLTRILKRPIKVNQFGGHLINLCRPERGAVLVSIGERGRARYRFKDPLMRAFVRLNTSAR